MDNCIHEKINPIKQELVKRIFIRVLLIAFTLYNTLLTMCFIDLGYEKIFRPQIKNLNNSGFGIAIMIIVVLIALNYFLLRKFWK